MGYSKDILIQPLQTNTLQCEICYDIVQSPVQCVHCDSLYCEKCFEEYKKINQTCSYCKQGELQVREINRLLKNILGNLQVRCRNEGCTQISSLEKLDQHEQSCQFLKIYCKNSGCKKYTYKKDAEIHKAFCQFKILDCSHCTQTFRQSEFMNHSCVQALKEQITGFQESIDSQDKKLEIVGQLKQIVHVQSEKIQQLEQDRKNLKDLISEVQINYQYALSQLQKNSIELEAYKKESQDQIDDLIIQVSELTNAVMQIQKLQTEQNSNLKKYQELNTIIEVSKVEHHEKKPKKKVKKDLAGDNIKEDKKEVSLNDQKQVNIACVQLEQEAEESFRKDLYNKQLTPLDIQRPKTQEDKENFQKDNKERKNPKVLKQNVNSKVTSNIQARNQELEKPIQLKKIQEAVNKALQNIKKPSQSPTPQEQQAHKQITNQQQQQPQQLYINSKSPTKPLLYIDVNISPGRKDRIVVYPGDTPEDLANGFSQKHNLDRYSKDQLIIMIRSQMKDL